MGLYIVAQIINGVADGLPDLIDSAFNLLLTFLQGIEDAIEEYTPQIIDAGIGIGEALIDGLVQAIFGGLGAVTGAITSLATSALEALKDVFREESPSKETYTIGKNAVLGLINSVKDSIEEVKETFRNLGRAAIDGIDPIAQALNKELEKSIEFSPLITPVLDLDSIDSGIAILNKSFANSRVLAELSYSGQLTSGEEDSTRGSNGSDGGVTFNQYNYSPKALDRETIYRQTRTQVAKLSERAFEK
jgi:phage-related protein